MTDVAYATYARDIGEKVSELNGIYWRQVRPFFFRPLLPFREYPPESARAPLPSCCGGFQYAVPPGASTNSALNIRIFSDTNGYSLDTLDYRRKRQVRLAQRHFDMRTIDDLAGFKKSAFPVYRSFYERTRYGWGSERYEMQGFSRWADRIFRVPGILILGGYRGQLLGGVSLSLVVEDTLIYATFFCDSESLRLNISDLMLHTVREAAAGNKDVTQIFAGMSSEERGLDRFYILRGCKLIRKPALLYLSPFARLLLKYGMPRQYAKIRGDASS